MSVAHIYNKFVSDHFDRDPFNIYRDSRERALQQIKSHLKKGVHKILDLGLGTGDLLMILHDLFPRADLVGIDASDKMIEAAKNKFHISKKKGAIAVFHDDVHHMGRHVDSDSIDLLTMHFLMNYVDPQKVFTEARQILKSGAVFSITTATEESFAILRILAGKFWSDDVIRAEARTVADTQALVHMLMNAGYRVLEEETFVKKIKFDDLKSLKDFSFHAGWCASKLLLDMDDETLKACEAIVQPFLPIHDEVKVAVVLAQKP